MSPPAWKRQLAPAAVIAVAAFLAVLPLVLHGCSCGHDFDFHLVNWLEVHAQFQRLVLVAQHFHLALLQRHGAASQRAGELHVAQQVGVFFEEVRVVGQVLRDGGGIQDSGHCYCVVIFGKSHSNRRERKT